MNKEEYKRYLQGHHWRIIKQRMYEKYRCCQRCGSTRWLEVHHLTYKNLGYEPLSDLLLLCRGCHYMKHNWGKGWKYLRPSDYIHLIWITLKKAYAVPYKRN